MPSGIKSVSWIVLISASVAAAGVVMGALNRAYSADISARDLTVTLFNSKPGEPIDFSNKDLRYLDLANIDFKQANLAGADLYGSDLTQANLSNANLSGVRLDRATIVATNFAGAHMPKVTILRPTTQSTPSFNQIDSATFAGADLKGARIIAFMDGANFTGADLSDADFSPFERQGSQWATVPMSRLNSANFTGALLTRVNFTKAILNFTLFKNADLRGAKFIKADLSIADLSGADVTGADFTGAILYETNLTGIKGRDQAIGLTPPKSAKAPAGQSTNH